MKRILRVVAILALLGAAIALWWRGTGRRRPLPCPPWLTGLVENPYVERLAGAQLLLDRAGIAAGMRVLDAGCGPGRLTLPAARRVGPAGDVVALDAQPRMLEELTRRVHAAGLANVRTMFGGLGEGTLQGKLQPGGFDRALLVTVLGELPDRLGGLREIFAALRPGGMLSVTEVLPDPHYQSQATVRDLAEDAGFEVRDVYGKSLAYTMNLVKPGPG